MNDIKRLSILTTLLFFLPIAFAAAHAKSGSTYEVNTDWLTVHNAPSNTSKIVGKLKRGNKVTIFQSKDGWFQTYVNGEKAWITSQHLIPVSEKEAFLTEGLLSGYTIVIDPGHGGKDPGAIGQDGVLEKDLILDTSIKIAKQLEESGANVILTRADDSFVSLQDRVLVSNESEADAFISIHFNAFDADYVGGINTYYHHNGKRLAHEIQQALAEEVSLRNRGVIQSSYRVIRDNQSPAVLIELGFITNTTELVTLQSENYQDQVARAITIALITYFWDSPHE
ncbi:N-acetylmuramoyl-L-alanine amidase [Ornithinibacillus californiensis]|uniref:N-acetylmuramoyl-L-alanine amidase n=1 Tax=Ornithinibacillus californiensis TaxID=161536 RepID=UPI00069E9C2F|nr:N-acetylmuramoyl-L-alanine amidase [Ornithinibacillus californiensis]